MRLHLLYAGLLVLLLLFLMDSATEESLLPPDEALRLEEEYDYFMTGVDSNSFNLDGSPRYRLQAERITHYPEPDLAVLESPRFHYFTADQPPWQIQSRNGLLDKLDDSERLILNHDVVITQQDGSSRPLQIFTESLTLFPEREQAETDLEVRLLSPQGEAQSIGMRADLKSNRVSLLRQVRGRYE